MTNLAKQEQVYYHFLEGSPFIFADERSKKKLLDLVFAFCFCQKWCLYAFCVTDSRAYFLFKADGAADQAAYFPNITAKFLQWYISESGIWSDTSPILEWTGVIKSCTADEIQNGCCAIHHIPLELKYVEKLQDYWWSSYNTYIGGFEWEAVDAQRLLHSFSDNTRIARSRLKKFHSSFEAPLLYITSLFEKNDAKSKKK